MKLSDLPLEHFEKTWGHAAYTVYSAIQANKIYEGLITSYPHTVVISQMKKIVGTGGTVGLYNDETVIRVILRQQVTEQTIQQLLHFAETAGWVFASSVIAARNYDDDHRDYKDPTTIIKAVQSLSKPTVTLIFEAKFSTEISSTITKKYKFLYHATPAQNVDKILKVGLTPKTRNKIANHPERIYLATTYEDLINELIPHLQQVTGIKQWAIFEIDTKIFESNTMRLFKDPAYPLGVFTLTNIPPFHLKLVSKGIQQ